MGARRRARLRAGVMIAGAMLLWPATARAREGPAEASAAVAFVRVFGSLSVDVKEDWEGPTVIEDEELAIGSAFVVGPAGFLLTNHHVVTGGRHVRFIQGLEVQVTLDVERVEVVLPTAGGQETFVATVLASDAELDLAVLQIGATDLPYLPLGDSDAMRPGKRVTVLGFPFGRAVEVGRTSAVEILPDPTVTSGSFSASRVDDDGVSRFVQTDAAVHPGSSGGPILDETDHVIGVVRMKLVEGTVEGPAFGVAINVVKEFLDTQGLSDLIPGRRLRRGVVHQLDWKGLRVELLDGMVDESPTRLRTDSGGSGGEVSFLAERFVTEASLRDVEKALLRGRIVRGFFPAEGPEAREAGPARPGRTRGSARGRTRRGEPFEIEYAVVKVGSGQEKVAARFLGPVDLVAYNRSLLRDAIETLEVDSLLTDEVRGPVAVPFEAVALPGLPADTVLPAGWTREPAARAACVRVPLGAEGVVARPSGDFTVTFRTLRWSDADFEPEQAAQACGRPKGTPPLAYARRYRKLGEDTGIWGAFRRRGSDVSLLEVEAPQSKMLFVRDLYVEWLSRVPE